MFFVISSKPFLQTEGHHLRLPNNFPPKIMVFSKKKSDFAVAVLYDVSSNFTSNCSSIECVKCHQYGGIFFLFFLTLLLCKNRAIFCVGATF